MRNPIQQLKAMPWIDLCQVAALAVAIVILIDSILLLAYRSIPLFQDTINLLLAPPLGVIFGVAIDGSIGALAVYLMERVFRQLVINIANLWGLTFCVIVLLLIKSFLPIPGLLLYGDQISFLGIVLGVFLKSWRYWRYDGGR